MKLLDVLFELLNIWRLARARRRRRTDPPPPGNGDGSSGAS